MRNVRTGQRFANNVVIGLCKSYSNPFEIIVQKLTQIKIRYDKIAVFALFVGVGAQNPYLMSFSFKVSDKVHCGNGRAVVFFSQNVANNCYNHRFYLLI